MNPLPGEVWLARLGRKLGALPAETMIEIKRAIAYALDLGG